MTSKNITYKEFIDYWLEVYKKPYLKPSSYKRILAEIKNHIPEEVKKARLNRITVGMIDKAVASVDLSRSRKYVYYVYHNSLHRAYCLGLITDNIAEKLFLVKHRQKRGQALTHEEQESFLKAIHGTFYENAFLFLLHSGIRRTELITLKYSDVHKKDGLIKISGTKTDTSERFIPLTDKLAEIIERQRERAKGELIFPYYADTLTHHFKRYSPNHRLHDLRHTYITRCAESGVNINVTQSLVGHKTLNTTLAIYTHVSTLFIKSEIAKLKI